MVGAQAGRQLRELIGRQRIHVVDPPQQRRPLVQRAEGDGSEGGEQLLEVGHDRPRTLAGSVRRAPQKVLKQP
jgi:hypothetical protein